MKLRIYTALAATSLALAVSCGLGDLEQKLGSLESRIKAIETVIPSLNNNIEALKALAGGGTIHSVEENYGTYKITLNNGQVITLTQGSIGVANPPLLYIDKDGYWLIDYQDGNGGAFILMDGQKVKAIGDNGITPQLGVDDGGFWTISYDGGTTWSQVLDNAGQPVSAIPSEGADEYFEDVTLENGEFTVTLKTGEKISLQVVPGFLFRIIAPNGLIEIEEGGAKAYQVVSEGIISATVLSKPQGFEVVLTDEQLLITAPVLSKAEADSDKDIAVLAVSEEGFTALAKLQVKAVRKEAEEFEEKETQDMEVEGTYLAHWDAGKSIKAGGVTLNKAMFPDLAPVHITAESNAPISADGVYFIDPGVTATYDMTNRNASRIIIIGNDPAERSGLDVNSQMRMQFTGNDDYNILLNLEVEFTNAADYHINITNAQAGTFEYLVFDNCSVTPHKDNLTLHYNGVEGKNVKRFAFVNSEMLVPVTEPVVICDDCGSKKENIYKMISANKGQQYGSLTFDNSLIYSKAATAVKFNIWDGYASGKTSAADTLTVKQCSFINLQINNGFVRASDIRKINIQRNIFYTPDNTVTSWQYIIRPEVNGPESGIGKDNYAYIRDNSTQNFKMFYDDSHMNYIRAEQFRRAADLFDTAAGAVYDAGQGKFVPAAPYRDYGVQRND